MLDEYDDGVDRFVFPECKNDTHPDDHWFLRPLCHAPTLVGPHWRERDDPPICGLPLGDYPHNEYGLADHEAGIVPDHAMPWHEFVQPPEPLVLGENAWRGNVCPGYIDRSWQQPEDDEDRRPKQCTCRCHLGTYYVNVYALEQGYGGPEEGGWYYEAGTPVASVPFDTLREAEAEVERLAVRFPPGRARYSVRPQSQDYGIHIEPHFAEPFPQHTPRYS